MSRKTPELKSKDQDPEKGKLSVKIRPALITSPISLKFYFASTLPYPKTPKDQQIDWQVSQNPPREVVKASKPSKSGHHFYGCSTNLGEVARSTLEVGWLLVEINDKERGVPFPQTFFPNITKTLFKLFQLI